MGETETKAAKPDFLTLAKQTIDEGHEDGVKKAKARIVPLILTSYDDKSLADVAYVKSQLVSHGYVNTVTLQNIETKTNFVGKFDTKYMYLLRLSQEDDYFIVPLFYFSDYADGRLGHHAELVDLLMCDILIFVTGIFHFKSAQLLNQIRIVPNQNHFIVSDAESLSERVLSFVEAYFPFVERNLLSLSLKKKQVFYRIDTIPSERGDSHDGSST